MKRARMIVLAIAIASAGLAALMANRMLSAPPDVQVVERSTVDTVEVLVASMEIGLGDTLSSGDLTWQAWPKSAALSGYVTRSAEPNAPSRLTGAIARAPFLSGEPIKEQKLIRATDGGVMAAILPTGMRAISTPIREETAAGGFILPNDRVDVIVTRRVRTSRREEHVSDTVLSNVRVLAIGQVIEQQGDAKVAAGRTATLELTPRQSEILALAQSMGELSLSLRSLTDASDTSEQKSDAFGDRGGNVRLLKYNVPSQAYGVN